VNYTAVVSVENPNGALLPGMTATAKFLTGSANNALTVVNSALRYRPTAEMLAQAGVTPSSASGRRDSTQRRASGEFAGQFAAGSQARTPGVGSRGALWYVGPDGKLKIVRVRTGLTDGQKTVVESDSLKAGMQVIIGTTGTSQAATATATSTSTNPLQPQGRGPGGQRGP
jgi:HlyD family secretion protein